VCRSWRVILSALSAAARRCKSKFNRVEAEIDGLAELLMKMASNEAAQ
jgi:hypothetical protein